MTHVRVLVVVPKSRAIRGNATAKIVNVTLTLKRPASTVHSTHHRNRSLPWACAVSRVRRRIGQGTLTASDSPA